MRPLDALAKVCDDVRPGEPAEGVLGVVPEVVAAPSGVDEAAEVMRVAAERDLAVVPRGAETRLDWGTPPERCDVLVDTCRLDRVIEHAGGDLVVKTEAGVSMEDLAGRLSDRGQRLALDTPLPGATVGGTIATGAAGPLRLLYGTPRDLVIGLTVVRADGHIARSGGKVVKNVAGYDLGRLFCGSYGTLGLIVEAAFRLHPVPAAHAYVTRSVDGPDEAHQAVQAVLHSPVVPSAIEFMGSEFSGPGTVAVLLEGVPAGVTSRAAKTVELLGGEAQISEDPPDGWGEYPDGTTLIDVSAPPPSFPHFLTALKDHALGKAAVTWSGSGHGHVGLPAELAPSGMASILTGIRDVLASHRGGAVVRYAPEQVRDEIDLWGPVPALALMKRVKDQFDPGHRLSPGRFAGGI